MRQQLGGIKGIGEDFTVSCLQLVGAWSEHFQDDVQSLPRQREFVAVLVALDEVEHQVADVECPTPYAAAAVPTQRLLVLGRTEEGDIACFIQLVHGIFQGMPLPPARCMP